MQAAKGITEGEFQMSDEVDNKNVIFFLKRVFLLNFICQLETFYTF